MGVINKRNSRVSAVPLRVADGSSNRNCPVSLSSIQNQRRKSQPWRFARDVRRADVAGAVLADVFALQNAEQDVAEGDRAEEIRDYGDDGVDAHEQYRFLDSKAACSRQNRGRSLHGAFSLGMTPL